MPNTNTNTTPESHSKTTNNYVNLKEAAVLTNRKVDTLRKWIKKGKLPATRKRPESKNSMLLIKRVDLLAYMSSTLEPQTTDSETSMTSTTLTSTGYDLTSTDYDLTRINPSQDTNTNPSQDTNTDSSDNYIEIIVQLEKAKADLRISDIEKKYKDEKIQELELQNKTLEEEVQKLRTELISIQKNMHVYEIEHQKVQSLGWLQRIFYTPTDMKNLLVDSKPAE